ncbi:MAG: hypothetical protein IJ568_07070 [Bacilli bacterium]|nr:hypothetical protein [Bacilli bacterium]
MKKRTKSQKKNQKQLLTIVGAVVLLIVGISVVYAALSTTLNITVGSVTQSQMSWNVAFQTGTVNATAGGTSATGRSCGAATVTADTVSVASTTLSKPDDSCTYALNIKNTGSIDATLATITPVAPGSTSCTNSGASMVCGNITYKLTTDSAGSTLLTTGGTLAKTNGTLPVYLVIKYTGSTPSSTAVEQSSGGFTLVYNQK